MKNPEKYEFDHRLPSGKVEIPLIKGGAWEQEVPQGVLPLILYQCATNNNWDHHQKEYYRHMENYLLHIQLQQTPFNI